MPVRRAKPLLLSSPPTPKTKGELTRTAIVEAGYRLFLRKGYHATSMRQIAQEANLALGGIYNHFDSKEDIFVAALEAHHPYHDMLPALMEARGETVEVYLRDVAERIVASLRRQPQIINLVSIELVEFDGRHAPVIAETTFPKLLEIMSKVQSYNSQLRLVPMPVMLRAFLGLFFSYYITESFIKHSPMANLKIDWISGMVDIFLHGIVAPHPEG